MEILNLKITPESDIISQAVEALRLGGLVIYPTETVYGLGADAANQQAVNKLLKFKGQRGLKPILIAVSDQNMAEKYVDLNRVARRLYQTFLPGPVAVVSRCLSPSDPSIPSLPSSPPLATGIASPEFTVGIRIPDYPLVLKIIQAFGKPITSTSANISGARNPWSIQDILETTPMQKLELIDLIIDAGQLPRRPPSTIIDTSREETEIVRQREVKIGPKAKGQRIKEEKYISNSPQQTENLARKLIVRLGLPLSLNPYPLALVIALHGPLGAGKTVFTKGIALALGIVAPIRSPSYTLVREYQIPLSLSPYPLARLYHLDAWRLSDPQEFSDLGLKKILRPGNIIVVEWIARLAPILDKLRHQAKLVLVKIDIVNRKQRRIELTINN